MNIVHMCKHEITPTFQVFVVFYFFIFIYEEIHPTSYRTRIPLRLHRRSIISHQINYDVKTILK